MRYKNLIKKVIPALLMLAAVGYLIVRFQLYSRQGYKSVVRYINSFGPLSAVIYILFFSFRTLVLIIPYSAMVVLGGSLFGPYRGFIYSMLAVFASASIAFLVGRYLGKDFVQKLIKGKVENLDSKVEKHGFKIILFMRLSTVFPFDILNYAAGLTKLSYKNFILGTVLGVIPETFSLSFLGSSIHRPFSKKFLLAVGLMALTVGIPFLFKRLRKKAETGSSGGKQ